MVWSGGVFGAEEGIKVRRGHLPFVSEKETVTQILEDKEAASGLTERETDTSWFSTKEGNL